MKVRLSESLRFLQRLVFLVIVFVSYSRNKLIKFNTSSIRCNVSFTFHYYLLAKLFTKAQNIASIYITTENVLARYDNYLSKTL